MLMALTITAIVSAIFSILALGVALYCAIELASFKKSTHSIQYVDPNIDKANEEFIKACLLYTSPSPRDRTRSRMPSSA